MLRLEEKTDNPPSPSSLFRPSLTVFCFFFIFHLPITPPSSHAFHLLLAPCLSFTLLFLPYIFHRFILIFFPPSFLLSLSPLPSFPLSFLSSLSPSMSSLLSHLYYIPFPFFSLFLISFLPCIIPPFLPSFCFSFPPSRCPFFPSCIPSLPLPSLLSYFLPSFYPLLPSSLHSFLHFLLPFLPVLSHLPLRCFPSLPPSFSPVFPLSPILSFSPSHSLALHKHLLPIPYAFFIHSS